MSIEEVIRTIVREEVSAVLAEFLVKAQVDAHKKVAKDIVAKDLEASAKPKRKRKTKAEKEAEAQAKTEAEQVDTTVVEQEAEEYNEIDEELADAEEKADEQIETVEVMEAHDLLREIKLLVTASDKDDAKALAKGTLKVFGVDKFTDVPEEKRIDCLSEVRRVLT